MKMDYESSAFNHSATDVKVIMEPVGFEPTCIRIYVESKRSLKYKVEVLITSTLHLINF